MVLPVVGERLAGPTFVTDRTVEVMGRFAAALPVHEFAVTRTLRPSVPLAPAVKVMLVVPWPPLSVPLLTDQLYVAPATVVAVAVAVLPGSTAVGAVMVTAGHATTDVDT